MTKIKFCGLTREEDIKAVNELKPDYIGFVFWPRSSRVVTREKASELKKIQYASHISGDSTDQFFAI